MPKDTDPTLTRKHGMYGHPFGGKRTPPKTRWCVPTVDDVKVVLRFNGLTKKANGLFAVCKLCGYEEKRS